MKSRSNKCLLVMTLKYSSYMNSLFCLAEGIHNSSIDESSVAGLESRLPFEEDNKMKELPTIKYDQKNVS